MKKILYTALEPLTVPRPVERVKWISKRCAGKYVLDLGCFDETALVKGGTEQWLHGMIAQEAKQVLGIDSSEKLPAEGLITGPRSKIERGNVMALAKESISIIDIDLIVAGELIEHLQDTTAFLRQLKTLFPGRELIISTPNATSLANTILALGSRESNHSDHLQIYSVKTLNTQCLRANLEDWSFVPYHVYFTEMVLQASCPVRNLIKMAESIINAAEFVFPMLSGGLILHVKKI